VKSAWAGHPGHLLDQGSQWYFVCRAGASSLAGPAAGAAPQAPQTTAGYPRFQEEFVHCHSPAYVSRKDTRETTPNQAVATWAGRETGSGQSRGPPDCAMPDPVAPSPPVIRWLCCGNTFNRKPIACSLHGAAAYSRYIKPADGPLEIRKRGPRVPRRGVQVRMPRQGRDAVEALPRIGTRYKMRTPFANRNRALSRAKTSPLDHRNRPPGSLKESSANQKANHRSPLCTGRNTPRPQPAPERPHDALQPTLLRPLPLLICIYLALSCIRLTHQRAL